MGRKLRSGVFARIVLVIASGSSVAFGQGAAPRAPATGRDVPPPSPTSGGTLPAAPPTTTEPNAPETGSDVAPPAPEGAAPAQETTTRPSGEAQPPAVGITPAPPSAPPTRFVPPNPVYVPEAARERPSRTWYGWQTLLVDGASIALLAAGASSNHDSGELVGLGVLGYFLGPAVVHIAHGNGGTAAGSIGMRLLPPILVIAGAASCFEGRCDSGQGALMVIGVLGFPAVIIVDAAALSYENDDEPAARRSASLRVAPFVDPKTHRGGFVIGGAF